MTPDRLAECRARLDGMAEQTAEEQAATLEFVHETLAAELDALLRRDDPEDGGRA